MNEPSIVFNEVNERQGVFTRRVFLMGGLTGLGIGALTGRLAQLQLIQNSEYRQLSDKNQFNFRLIVPPRGLILDRNNVPLASNRPNFRVLISRDSVKDVGGTLDALGEIIAMTPDRRRAIERQVAVTPRFTPVSVADDLTWEQFAAINVRAPELPGVTADMGEARVYPFGGAFSHVIGYVAKASKSDLDSTGSVRDELTLHPSFRIGKQGVEKALDKQLRGMAGGQKVEVDARGRVVREDPDGDIKATPGQDIQLTLDADIQNRALEVFGEESGAAVMIDVRNGDILCLLSAPAFDPNSFVRGVPGAEYRALSQYERKPLLDKALSGLYPPGSTFKTMVALAALESGIDPNTSYTCGGVFPFGNHVFKCDQVHGTLNMTGAIATSCDIYFYRTALQVGVDKIAEVARRFGLGQTFDIGISGQKAGIVPDQAWKKKYFRKTPANQKWFPGETPSVGIGQGYTVVNPLQLCVMAARLANGRKSLHPRLVHSIGGVEQPRGNSFGDLPIDPGHLDFVRRAMAQVTTSGTAARVADLGLGPIKMAGKTGTAQSHSYKGGRGAYGARGEWALRDHAWFVAFAPYDDPRYALSVLVEHGGFGAQAAAPRAREIMRVALLKDPEVLKRVQTPLPMPEITPSAPGGVGPDVPPPLEL